MLLTDTADECNTTTARFDVADVGREWLQTVACVNAYRSLYAAFHANGTSRTVAAVETAGNEMNTVLLEIDSLLSSVPGFLFGAWIRDAIALGTTTASKEQLAASAKIQVTDWASYPPAEPWSHKQVVDFSSIQDYAIKQWGGLMWEYQAVRLRMFSAQVAVDVEAGSTTINVSKFVGDMFTRQQKWVQEPWNATTLTLSVNIVQVY